MDDKVKVRDKIKRRTSRRTDSEKRAAKRERNQRYRQKTCSIPVPVELTEELRRIGEVEGLSSDRDIISLLVTMYNQRLGSNSHMTSKSQLKDVALQTDDEPVLGQSLSSITDHIPETCDRAEESEDRMEFMQEIDIEKYLSSAADGELEPTHQSSYDGKQGIKYVKDEHTNEKICITPGSDGSQYCMGQLLTLEGQTFTIKQEVEEDVTDEEEKDQCTKQDKEFECGEHESKSHITECSGEKMQRCSHWSEIVTDGNSLSIHQKSHSGECESTSNPESGFAQRLHQKSHSEECEPTSHSESGFSQTLHQKSHSGNCEPSTSHPPQSRFGQRCFMWPQCENFNCKDDHMTFIQTDHGDESHHRSDCEEGSSERDKKVECGEDERQPHITECSVEKMHRCSNWSEIVTDDHSLSVHQKSHTCSEECEPTSNPESGFAQRLHQKSDSGECEPTSLPPRSGGFSENLPLTFHLTTHNADNPYSCSYCEKEFSEMITLICHMKTHTKEKPYQCSLCEKTFSSTSSLNRHIISHTCTKDKLYHCSQCEKEFSFKSSLNRHIISHTMEELYRCSHCEKEFSFKSSLNRHMRTHFKEKCFQCSECSKRFSQKMHLICHKRRHTKEKPYPCSHCGKRFSRKGSLECHISTHTGEKPYPCPNCGKRFCCKDDLSLHIRTHNELLSLLTKT